MKKYPPSPKKATAQTVASNNIIAYGIFRFHEGMSICRFHELSHTIATCFYDSGVSLQSIRDYLGHDYEEMTEQYIDYMPKKIEKASEDYFSRHSLASYIKRGEEKDG